MNIAPRPMGQILGDAVNGLGRVWKPLLTTSLMVFIPVGILTLIVFQSLPGAVEFVDLVFNDPAYLQTLDSESFLSAAAPFLKAAAIGLILQAVGGLFVFMVSHRLVAGDMAGYTIGGADARRHALKRFLGGLAAGISAFLATGILLGLGFFIWSVPLAVVGTPTGTSVLIALVLFGALVGPGIWVSISLSMFSSVIVIEGRGPFGALRRSMQLVRTRWWPTFGFLLVVGLLGSVAVQLIQLVAIPLSFVTNLGSGVTIASVLGIGAQGLIVAALGAMYTVWYIDLRARKEPVVNDDLS